MILLTGFPGFLASALVPHILQRSTEPLVCLVQPAWMSLAQQRVAQLMALHAELEGRIELVLGDLTLPHLGLPDTFPFAKISECYHFAAVYDLGVKPDLAERVNVVGTQNVLEVLSRSTSLKALHYVSTCYVSGRFEGVFKETDLYRHGVHNNAYEATKYAAEVEVWRARDKGMPVAVYRPAIVVGDATTGETQKYDGPYALMRWMDRWPKVAPIPLFGNPRQTYINVVPRSFVIEAMAYLSGIPEAIGQVFALADPAPLTVGEMLDVLSSHLDKQIVKVRLPLPLVQKSMRGVGALRNWVGIEPESFPYFTHPTRYDTSVATKMLQPAGIVCPPFPAYIDALVQYMRAHPGVSSRPMI